MSKKDNKDFISQQIEEEYQPQFGDEKKEMDNELKEYKMDSASAVEKTASVKTERKGIFKFIHPSIFVAICVFLAALIGLGVYYVFCVKTIVGTWVLEVPNTNQQTSTADEAKKQYVYYDFGDTDKDGKGQLSVYQDGLLEKSDYSITSENDTLKVTIGQTEFTYSIEGIKLFGTATLTITPPDTTDESTGQIKQSESYKFKQDSMPDLESDTYKDYKTESKLIGKWSYSQEMDYYGQSLSMSNQFEFKDNGILINTQKQVQGDNELEREYYFAYTVEKNNKIKLKLISTDEDYEVTYTLKGNELSFDNKGIFQSMVVYKDGKQPKETTAQETTVQETTKATKSEKTTKAN